VFTLHRLRIVDLNIQYVYKKTFSMFIKQISVQNQFSCRFFHDRSSEHLFVLQAELSRQI